MEDWNKMEADGWRVVRGTSIYNYKSWILGGARVSFSSSIIIPYYWPRTTHVLCTFMFHDAMPP
jgi:hypothetical protein